MEYKLSTEHPASSYGIPVLVDETGKAFGPRDIVEGVEAWALVTSDSSPLAGKFIKSANLQQNEIDQTQITWDLPVCEKCGLRHSDLMQCA